MSIGLGELLQELIEDLAKDTIHINTMFSKLNKRLAAQAIWCISWA